jgi:hypothetical protein
LNLLAVLGICLALITTVESFPKTRADEEAGEDYPELGADDLAERLAEMPDVASNVVDPALKKRLIEKYGKRPFTVSVDSIEPEGGPTSGGTRVLVRGGPF